MMRGQGIVGKFDDGLLPMGEGRGGVGVALKGYGGLRPA